jgi:hypothetical protein
MANKERPDDDDTAGSTTLFCVRAEVTKDGAITNNNKKKTALKRRNNSSTEEELDSFMSEVLLYDIPVQFFFGFGVSSLFIFRSINCEFRRMWTGFFFLFEFFVFQFFRYAGDWISSCRLLSFSLSPCC